MKLIDLHKQWMETGELKYKWFTPNGLCGILIDAGYKEYINLFEPTEKEKMELLDKELCTAYWGSGLSLNSKNSMSAYTPLRQTIVLLIANMENEY